MQSLTKENFWDELMAQYPTAVGLFCDWIDQYKKEVNWNILFNSNSDYQDMNGKNAAAPKFHDLPIDMQTGIVQRFFLEHFPVLLDTSEKQVETIKWFFVKLEAEKGSPANPKHQIKRHTDSPDAGHPDCICDLCGKPITWEDAPALRIFFEGNTESRFHTQCGIPVLGNMDKYEFTP